MRDVLTSPGIRLELKDDGTGVTTLCSISLHDAKQLFGALRSFYRQEMQADPELFVTVPRVSLDLTKYLPPDVIEKIPESPLRRISSGTFDIPDGPQGVKERNGVKVELLLTDKGTKVQTCCRLTKADAVQLYEALREVFGDFERNRDELYLKPITCEVKAELQVFKSMPKISGV